MITNQWYAVLSSHELKPNKVTAARRFGENLVFFRDNDGKPGCVTDLCAHRGASLEKGCVKEGHIQCPFHGIEYDLTGKCVHIPSEGRASDADFSRFNLKHYEVREIGDIILSSILHSYTIIRSEEATKRLSTAPRSYGSEAGPIRSSSARTDA